MASRKTTSADEYEEAQRVEWTSYVAAVPIDYYGVRAYNTGDPVPRSAVAANGGWVSDNLVTATGDSGAYEGSTTVVSPEPPTIDETSTAAPAASTPAPTDTTGA